MCVVCVLRYIFVCFFRHYFFIAIIFTFYISLYSYLTRGISSIFYFEESHSLPKQKSSRILRRVIVIDQEWKIGYDVVCFFFINDCWWTTQIARGMTGGGGAVQWFYQTSILSNDRLSKNFKSLVSLKKKKKSFVKLIGSKRHKIQNKVLASCKSLCTLTNDNATSRV